MTKPESQDYHDYVIKDGKFIGAFEEMYQNIDDPWHHGGATAIQCDLALYLINRYSNYDSGSVLDIGCGEGAFTVRIKRQLPNAHILAVDIAPTAIKKAKQKYGNLGIEFQVMDIQKEYRNISEQFNLIVMSGIMWYILPNFGAIVNYLGEKILKKDDAYLLTSQPFYKPEEQKYGKEIVSTVEDMLNLIDLEVVEMVELNRLSNHTAIVLFKRAKA